MGSHPHHGPGPIALVRMCLPLVPLPSTLHHHSLIHTYIHTYHIHTIPFKLKIILAYPKAPFKLKNKRVSIGSKKIEVLNYLTFHV